VSRWKQADYPIVVYSDGEVSVSCPGWKWGLCNGHHFATLQEAEAWIAAEEEQEED
jgi:hypothetical protein